jgi:hypothetical protein
MAGAPNEERIINMKRLLNERQETTQCDRHQEQNGANRAWSFPVQHLMPAKDCGRA